jgi:hypothetical protein
VEGFGKDGGLPTGTRTPIVRLGGGCSILLSYREKGGHFNG